MSLPRITPNGDYDDGGKYILSVTSDADPGGFREALGEIKCAYAMEPNPYNRNGQPIRHMDNTNGAVHLTYYGKKVSDAVIMGANPSTGCVHLWLVFENGDRDPYACGSKDEFEWIRKGLGRSSLDYHPFKV